MRILIIDDNEADREFYKKHITESPLFSNVKIEECGSLCSAFKVLKENEFDLIILDLGLPESEGIQTVINTFKELHKNISVPPVIVLTGLDDHVLGTEVFKHGAKDFLIKSEVVKNCKELSRSIQFATYSLNINK